jgi:2-polyprenyl-6-methoxyphenol hydroxylase-like FAD-dependent oxidoreductase
MAKSTVDVLVVGAGPTGLTLACELVRHGLSCRVIDQLAAPVTYSKAAVVHARTMEVFDDMGVADAILGHTKVLHGANVYADGKRVAHIGIGGLESAYPSFYGVSQHDTEVVLTARLRELGVSIERSRRLDAFDLRDDGVTATVVPAEGGGAAEAVEARWLVGCDGAHSTVRKALGFSFEGSAYEEHLVQADVRVEWPRDFDDEEIHTFLHPDGAVACFPLFKDGRYRVIFFMFHDGPELPMTLETFQTLADQRMPKGTRLVDPAWMVAFRIHCRRTNHYRKQSAFVAGDAAHIHSPAGGQGMNTGIQDAYNLAWKLALVQAGAARERLLDSYEAERMPVAAQLLATTDGATKGITTVSGLRNPIAVGLRNGLMRFVTSIDAIQSRFTRGASMLEINYRESPVVAQDRASVWSANVASSKESEAPSVADWAAFGDGPAPGDRAADVELGEATDGDARRPRLLDVLRGTRHTLLLFDGAAATAAGYENLAQIASDVQQRYGERVAVQVVVPHPKKPDALKWDGGVLCDPEGALHKRYGARSECLYLVRPDGYVAYRTQPADGAKLQAYLGSIFA